MNWVPDWIRVAIAVVVIFALWVFIDGKDDGGES
jgi:hypothetical protein